MALSFSFVAFSNRAWVFCRRATRRNVIDVVGLLSQRCHIWLFQPWVGNSAAQMTTNPRHAAKNGAWLTNLPTALASRSKPPGPSLMCPSVVSCVLRREQLSDGPSVRTTASVLLRPRRPTWDRIRRLPRDDSLRCRRGEGRPPGRSIAYQVAGPQSP